MKKLVLAITLILILVGCTAIKQATFDAKTCLADPVCREEAIREAESAKGTAVAISGISPIPLSSNIVGGAVYGIVLVWVLIKKGRKKQESVPLTP